MIPFHERDNGKNVQSDGIAFKTDSLIIPLSRQALILSPTTTTSGISTAKYEFKIIIIIFTLPRAFENSSIVCSKTVLKQ